MIKIYGSSDDLIEVEGEIREEFTADSDEKNLLAFSDGTVLSVRYDDNGMWRISRIYRGEFQYSKVEADSPDENYSDIVTLTNPLATMRWLVFGTELATSKKR